ncbi:DsbA family protein [Rothia mucilaginosa]|uniref:DSBA oxidoreductase n=1 Tax=Rothia mucilaginosa TaxID=43675 RepID=A0A0K2RY47_9MICC|nr:thioredoxin domain-containing protein [Rothia mucilaginosa]BAS19758.1 DSBA oxidoreductase [Rothia mucilaginosa]
MSTDAREKARQIAAQQAKKSPSQASRRWLQLGVLAVVLVIVGIIGFVVINGNKNTKVAESGPVPSSANEYGGIVLTKDGIVQNSSTQETRDFKQLATSTSSVTPMVNGTVAAVNTLPPGVQTAEEASKNGQPVRVTIFQDYNCVHCAEFEKKYGDEIQKLVEDGTITLEIRNLTFLDRSSPTAYSARNAAAAYSVANQVSTSDFLNYQREIFTHQGRGDMNNQQIADIASKYHASIGSDMNDGRWRPFVDVVNAESAKNGIQGTPTVFVDGDQYTSNDFSAFLKQKIEAKKK